MHFTNVLPPPASWGPMVPSVYPCVRNLSLSSSLVYWAIVFSAESSWRQTSHDAFTCLCWGDRACTHLDASVFCSCVFWPHDRLNQCVQKGKQPHVLSIRLIWRVKQGLKYSQSAVENSRNRIIPPPLDLPLMLIRPTRRVTRMPSFAIGTAAWGTCGCFELGDPTARFTSFICGIPNMVE